MNSIGRPFYVPPAALPDRTAALPRKLGAVTASFLDPIDLNHFAQTSKHNYQGAALAVKARLKSEFCSHPQPFMQFADPRNRLDTAIPLDEIGEEYLETEMVVKGPLTLELIKRGDLTVAQASAKWQEINDRLQYYDNPLGSFVFAEDNVVLDYIVAGYLTEDQIKNLPFLLMDKDIDLLCDYTVREAIKQGYLSFERALDLSDEEWQLLASDEMRLAIGQGKPMDLEARFAEIMDEPS